MLNKLRKEQGFTLIELLIVVAIIGILAAIAIPQFAAYRQKGFNSAAVADVKNAKTGQESLFADNQTYGESLGGQNAAAILLTAIPNPGTTAVGIIISGPAMSASATTAGACLAGPRQSDGLGVGVGVGISNGVNFYAENSAPVNATTSFGSGSYLMVSKHTQGTRVFYAEQPSTAIYYVQNDQWASQPLAVGGGLLPAISGIPLAPTLAAQVSATTAGGGSPIAVWTAM